MAELKPLEKCEFCDSKNLFYVQGAECAGPHKEKWGISCGECGHATELYDTKEQAIDAWNKRSK